MARRALIVGVAILIVAGGAVSLALGEFPGLTWFVVRLLITAPFLLACWGLFGTDAIAATVGAIVLALMWATHSQFLGPVGLPDTPLRILDAAPPPATVRWLHYKELWLISFPIYLVAMLAAMWLASRGRAFGESRRPAAAAGLIPIVLLTAGFTVEPDARGVSTTFAATGDVEGVGAATGDIRIAAADMGNRVTPLPPHDRLSVDAPLDAGAQTYALAVRPRWSRTPSVRRRRVGRRLRC